MTKKFISSSLLAFSVTLVFFVQISFAQETPTPTPTPAPTPVKVTVEGQTKNSIRLFRGQSINLETPAQTIKLKSTNETFFTVSRPTSSDKTWKLTIKPETPNGSTTQIVATSGGDNSPRSINVEDGFIEITSFELPDASTEPLKISEFKTLDDLFSKLNLDEDLLKQIEITKYSELKFDGDAFTADNPSSSPTITYRAKNTDLVKTATFRVVSNVSQIDIRSNNKSLIAYAGSTFTLSAQAKDDGGTVSPTLTDEIEWSVVDGKKDANTGSSPGESVILLPKGRGEVDVYVLKAYQDPITLTAKVKGNNLAKNTYSFFAKGEQSIIGFSNIEMRLNLMDERTAKDLFGGVAVDDYMVAKLRIFNKVPEDQNGGPSSSILFFSEGLEVNVSLEKRSQEKNRSGGKAEWKPLDLEDIEYINNWVYIKNTDDELIKYFVTREQLECTKRIKAILGKESCQINTSELDRLWYFYEKENCNTTNAAYVNSGNIEDRERCVTVAGKNWIPFRPYAFLIIASTHDRRSERSVRERVLKVANSLSSFASFATTFARPMNNSGFVFGLDKYSNLLVPSFEKLFPSRREVQRKNILDMTLQPVEEVPFGKEVSKVVFIPKQVIEGILPGYDVRITTVSVSKIKAEASVVKKEKIENR